MIRPRRRIFFGWWIVVAGFGVQALVGGLLFHAYGAYVVLLQRDFGWSRTTLSVAFSLARVEDGILGPFQGWMVDRFGPRAVMQVGLLLFGGGFMLFSRVDSLATFYAVFILMALGASLGSFLSITTAIVNWFDRRRSLAIGLSMIGFAAGGLVQPLVVAALDNYGWRGVAFASGVIIIAAGMPMTALVRHRPEPYGYLPDGGPAEGEGASDGAQPADAGEVNFTPREAMRTRSFWFISLGHAASLLVVSAVMVHLVAHLNESLGYSLTQAASVVTLMTAMTVIGQVGGGFMGDRVNMRLIMVSCMLGHAAGLLLLAFATSLWMVIAFAVLHGLAWGARVPVIIAVRAEYFGAQSFGTIMGFSSLIVMLGMIVGPIFAGVMYDRTGSYEAGFTVLAVFAALGLLFFVFSPKPPPPLRVPAEPAPLAEPRPAVPAAVQSAEPQSADPR